MAEPGPVEAVVPSDSPPGADALRLLREGDLEVVGRIVWSSNATFLARVRGDGTELDAVYKPRRGERPLWDFPTGSLHRRELAAWELSRALGWAVVPETVVRDDGPLGEGMLQRYVDHDPEEHYFTLLEEHEDRFRLFATFDVLANNADRKGGHVLRSRHDGHVWGIDHGLTFHEQWKLRTVIWEFAGEPVPGPLVPDVGRLVEELDGALGRVLAGLLSPGEVAALAGRARNLLATGTLPEPEAGYHSMPWPIV